MPKNSQQKKDDSTLKNVELELPSAKEIYGSLMFNIEPDLMLENIPLLNEKYAGETKSEREKRWKRYKKAFKRYNKEFNAWLTEFKRLIKKHGKSGRKEEERIDRLHESEILDQFSSQFT